MEDKIDRDAIEDIIGLTPLQKGILFHLIENPYSEAYVEKVCIELEGYISDTIFRDAWRSVANAHDTMRAVFRWETIQNPAQVILKEKEILIEISGIGGI